MAYTYDLICEELKLCVWIGQGNEFTSFYSGAADTMEDLHDFLRYTRGHELRLVGEAKFSELDEADDFQYKTIAQFKRDNPQLDWIYPPL